MQKWLQLKSLHPHRKGQVPRDQGRGHRHLHVQNLDQIQNQIPDQQPDMVKVGQDRMTYHKVLTNPSPAPTHTQKKILTNVMGKQ